MTVYYISNTKELPKHHADQMVRIHVLAKTVVAFIDEIKYAIRQHHIQNGELPEAIIWKFTSNDKIENYNSQLLVEQSLLKSYPDLKVYSTGLTITAQSMGKVHGIEFTLKDNLEFSESLKTQNSTQAMVIVKRNGKLTIKDAV